MRVIDNGYIMETADAEHTHICMLRTAGRVIDVLETHVWPRPYPVNWDWRKEFVAWAKNQHHDTLPMLRELYPPGVKSVHHYIHGDPTLSNVVYTRHGRVQLIDPIAPTGKVPGLREVDIGKLLQSVIGWEHLMYGWPPPAPYVMTGVAHRFTDEELRRAVFWLGVHALRILPYADKRPHAKRWALAVAAHIFESTEWRHPCSMLSTLMGLSRTLARQSR